MKPAKHIWMVALLAAACGSGSDAIESNTADVDRENEEAQSGGSGSRDGGSKTPRGSSGNPTTGKSEDGTCESHQVGSRKATPDMLIVLDRSASMSPQGNPNMTDRWRGSVDAVLQVTEEFSSRINFGLMTFPAYNPSAMPAMPAPDPNDPLGGLLGGLGGILTGLDPAVACAAGTVNVDIGLDKGPAIATSLGMITPGGFTPTASTLEAAAKVLGSGRQMGDEVVPPKYVLLLTDGDPNCSDGGGRGGMGGGGVDQNARRATITAIEKLRDDGIQTYVVGYQTAGSNFVQQLDAMAAAGGTGDTMHRSVSSPGDLEATFNEIAGRALSCSFKLDKPVDDVTYVRVTLRGETLKPNNAASGFTLGADKQTVTVTGEACDQVQGGATFTVKVECDQVFVQ